MAKNIVIGFLLVSCIWLATIIVRIENQRYALVVGLCRDKAVPTLTDLHCLATVETRSNKLWHLFYAIKD